jgi:hypothetical protein
VCKRFPSDTDETCDVGIRALKLNVDKGTSEQTHGNIIASGTYSNINLSINYTFLHDANGMNACTADHVWSVRMIQLENRWTDLDEI